MEKTMEKTQIIDYALHQTMLAHQEFHQHLEQVLLSNVNNPINLKNFTKKNGARDLMNKVNQQDLVEYLLDEVIKIYNAASYFYGHSDTLKIYAENERYLIFKNLFPYYDECAEIIKKLSTLDANLALYTMTNEQLLIQLVNIVAKTKFSNANLEEDKTYFFYINENGHSNTIISKEPIKTTAEELQQKIKHDFSKVAEMEIEDLNINYQTLNKCTIDILNGKQLTHVHNQYAGESLYLTQDIGRKRSNQEDCAIIFEHPQDKNIKLIAVSDGMGGVDFGDKASLYIIQKITKWFNALPLEAAKNIPVLSELFAKKVFDISNEIYQQYNSQSGTIKAGATFTGAIVSDCQTVVLNVGDSRAYTIKDGQLDIITRDQSAVWNPSLSYQELGEENIDEMRFDYDSRKICNCIGRENITDIRKTIIGNEQYDRLILTTDGVSDLLSIEKFKIISANTPKELVTKFLVEEAINYNAYRNKPESEYHTQVIDAGKDNATAAMYARR